MTEQGNAQWEYRIAVAQGDHGLLESVDGGSGPLCYATGTSEVMSIVQALDVWGATGWELVGLAALPEGRVQYVLKRPRHQGGWEGARIHMQARKR
jgi:hypothetical protein